MAVETVLTVIIGAASVISPAIIIAVLVHTNNSLAKKVEESIRHIVRVEEKLDSHTTNYDIQKKSLKMSPHDLVAEHIARIYGAQYNRGAGADIVTNDMAIEVETYYTVPNAERQLSDYNCPVYVAGSSESAAQRAIGYYGIYDIGVMDSNGIIRKNSTRNG